MPDLSDQPSAGKSAGKQALRSRLLADRRARTADGRAADSARIRTALLALVARLRPAVLAAYAPLRDEPGGPELPDTLAAAVAPHGGRLLLPVLRDDLDLDWAVYVGPASLAPARRGLREPAGARLGRPAIGAATLVVVPALAVDRAGRRLGRGGGSYDRALARVGPAAVTLALLFDRELLDDVPGEPHDRPVHGVITASGGLQWVIRPPI